MLKQKLDYSFSLLKNLNNNTNVLDGSLLFILGLPKHVNNSVYILKG